MTTGVSRCICDVFIHHFISFVPNSDTEGLLELISSAHREKGREQSLDRSPVHHLFLSMSELLPLLRSEAQHR